MIWYSKSHPESGQTVVMNLTDEERVENERSVLDDLDLFG